jgi:uncharacterized protein
VVVAKSKLDQLSDLLLGLLDEHDETMLVEELDGFLAGVIVSPDMIPPSRWMPHIWSESGAEDHAPVFQNRAQVQRITGLIMDHYNTIALSLLPNSVPYEPIFAVDTRNDDVIWEMWADGFRRAIALSPASWLAVIESGDRDAINALAGLHSLIAIAGGESTLPKPEQDRLTAEAPDLIPEWVETLSYWRLARNPIAQASANAAFKNIGRNHPCPCGSGRKYKKCHGAN